MDEHSPIHEAPKGYIPAIDGLRCLAVMMVLWHHIPYLFDESLHKNAFWRASHGGAMGVDLFFVISGFLITTILRRSSRGAHPFKTFWIRRALRIFPVFYLYMALCGLVIYGLRLYTPTSLHPRSIGEMMMFLFYLANVQIVRESWYAGEFNILWSLSIEEQFYLLWPFIVFRFSRRQLMQICFSIILLGPLFRILAAWMIGLRAVYVLPMCRADPLIVGALIACLLEKARWRAILLRASSLLFGPAALLLVYILGGSHRIVEPGHMTGAWLLFSSTLIALIFGIFVSAAIRSGPVMKAVFAAPPLVYLGRISYGIYLWHWLTADTMLALLDKMALGHLSPIWKIIFWLILTFGVSALSWHFFERPVAALKRRFSYSTAEAMPHAPD